MMAGWIFSGWPRIWQNPPIPPKIQEAKAETQVLRPNGTGFYQDWETLVGTSHWEATNDDPVDDSTYIETQVQGRVDIQALANPTFDDSDTVNSVTIYCRAYAIGTKGPEKISFFDRLDTTDRDQEDNIGVTRDSWDQYNSATLITAPDGGGWTKQKVTDLQVGIITNTLGAETLRVSEIWIVVDYTPPAVSISITNDIVTFQTVALDATVDNSSDLPEITVDSGPADLNVKSTVFIEGANTWTLHETDNGPNRVLWEFSKNGTDWAPFAVAGTEYTFDTNVPTSDTRNLYLRLTVPTETASYNQYSSTVTVVAF